MEPAASLLAKREQKVRALTKAKRKPRTKEKEAKESDQRVNKIRRENSGVPQANVSGLTSSSRVDSAMRGSSISFLTRASVAWLDSCFGSFLCILARCHECKGITGQFGTGLAVSALFSYRAVLNSLYQSAKCSISNVKLSCPDDTVRGLDYRRRTVSEDRRRV